MIGRDQAKLVLQPCPGGAPGNGDEKRGGWGSTWVTYQAQMRILEHESVEAKMVACAGSHGIIAYISDKSNLGMKQEFWFRV